MGDYTSPPSGQLGEVKAKLEQIQRQLREEGRPSGSQTAEALDQLRDLVNNLAQAIENVSASGATWQGPVSTSGSVTANGGVNSTGVYNNLLVSAYRVQYVNSAGSMGYVPSSARFKRDIETAPDAREAMLAMRVVTFRYIEAVEDLGDEAAVEWGLIAEELHDLGFTWAVDYDEDGLPFGVKHDRLVLAVIPVVQDHEQRLNAAGL